MSVAIFNGSPDTAFITVSRQGSLDFRDDLSIPNALLPKLLAQLTFVLVFVPVFVLATRLLCIDIRSQIVVLSCKISSFVIFKDCRDYP